MVTFAPSELEIDFSIFLVDKTLLKYLASVLLNDLVWQTNQLSLYTLFINMYCVACPYTFFIYYSNLVTNKYNKYNKLRKTPLHPTNTRSRSTRQKQVIRSVQARRYLSFIVLYIHPQWYILFAIATTRSIHKSILCTHQHKCYMVFVNLPLVARGANVINSH